MPTTYLKPYVVKIGGLDYTVEWKPTEWEMETHAYGECYTDREVIRICDSLNPHRAACVFAHEVAHALAAHYKCFHEIDPEQAANIASYGMVMFWRDNPDVFQWWIRLII